MFYQSFKQNFLPLNKTLAKLGLSIIFMIIFSGVSAQKCNYEKNEIDALTELVVKRTEPQLLCRINGQPLFAKAQCIGTNKYLKLVFYKFNDYSFQEDREVGFRLSNNEELLIYPRVMPVDSSKMDDLANVNSLLVYKLTSEQYEQLKIYPVKKFKYFVTSGFIEETIAEKRQHTIINVLKCID